MTTLLNALYTAWNQVVYAMSSIRIFDVIDILAMAFIIYKLIGFARETRAGQLVKGLIVLFLMYLVASWVNLPTIRWLLSLIVNSALVVFVVVFHPEIRRMLEKVGSSKLRPSQIFNEGIDPKAVCIENICKAAGIMQDSKIGALIVFERNVLLGEIINTGNVVDAVPSISMVNNIFFPKSPLHDGAAIVRGDRIYAAGCILPLTQNNDISPDLGTRHRAAIGITEQSDAVVLVVSEETGNISIVENGVITRNYNSASATLELKRLLLESSDSNKDAGITSKLKSIFVKQNNESSQKEEKSNEK